MSFIKFVFQDWSANLANPTKGKYIVVLFRFAQLIKRKKILFVLFFWYLLLYRVIIEWFMCVELSWNTEIGSGFQIYHGSGLVIHPKSSIGKNFRVRQCTTIGVKQNKYDNYSSSPPRIGDNVDVGCNTVIIGDIQIGDEVRIGAGSVVIKNLPNACIAVGNPAKVIRYLNPYNPN